jgi:hypothetical protein
MLELLNESVALVNMPFTILVLVAAVYWLLMIFGMVGSDAISGDVDGGGFDADAGGASADLGADIGSPKGLATGGGGGGAGALSGLLNFANARRVPIMVVLSIFFFSMWAVSVLLNYHLNPGRSILIGLALLIPNFIGSILVTKVATQPLIPLFKRRPEQLALMSDELIGHTAVLRLPIEGSRLGQAEAMVHGTEYRLNVRSSTGQRIERGAQVVIVNRDEKDGVFLVSV